MHSVEMKYFTTLSKLYFVQYLKKTREYLEALEKVFHERILNVYFALLKRQLKNKKHDKEFTQEVRYSNKKARESCV